MTYVDEDPQTADWRDVPDADITVGEVLIIPVLPCADLRILSSGAEAADRGFGIIGITNLPG